MAVTLELLIKKGSSQGQILSLDGQRSVTIGRAHGNTLVLADEKVSSNHCRLDLTTSGVILTDVGSKNGTYVDGEAVAGSRVLPPGVEVALGHTVFELRWREDKTDRIVVPVTRRRVASNTQSFEERSSVSRRADDAYRDVVLS